MAAHLATAWTVVAGCAVWTAVGAALWGAQPGSVVETRESARGTVVAIFGIGLVLGAMVATWNFLR